ncbi:helix-turn-helix transcriptional regulator [Cupriavidus sp. 30B13]|uniref:helix-turn-helix transcriptional regulator n=1 Tax=Cupriavidus sp. 30B13 TaxID=3384241 RepID=UPI003B91C50B
MSTFRHNSAPPQQSFPNLHAPSANATQMVFQFGKALRILRMAQLIERTGLSRATLYVLMAKDPTFPPKILLTARCVGFYEHEVEAWLASRAQRAAA